MSEGVPPLDSKLRSLVEAERAADDLSPPPDKLEAVGGRLWASLGLAGVPPAAAGVGAGAAAGKAVATGAAAATAATAAKAATSAGVGKAAAAVAGGATVAGGTALVLKSVIVAAAFGAAALTTYAVVGPKRDAAAPSSATSKAASQRLVSPAPASSTSSSTGDRPESAASALPRVAPSATKPAAAKRATTRPGATKPGATKPPTTTKLTKPARIKSAVASKPATNSSTIGVERALLERARAALSTGKPSTAMALLEMHRRRYRSGALSEEREALTIMALAKRGRLARARELASAFRRRHPSSLLWRAIERALASAAAAAAGDK